VRPFLALRTEHTADSAVHRAQLYLLGEAMPEDDVEELLGDTTIRKIMHDNSELDGLDDASAFCILIRPSGLC
jgi:hypothetical protein